MVGLILLYFAGKAFYDLAGKHGKNQWGFAILGVISYYAGLFLGGILVGLTIEIVSPGLIDDSNELLLGIIAVPVGVLTCWGTYQLLKRSWSKPKDIAGSTLDSGLISEQPGDRYDQSER